MCDTVNQKNILSHYRSIEFKGQDNLRPAFHDTDKRKKNHRMCTSENISGNKEQTSLMNRPLYPRSPRCVTFRPDY